MKRLILTLSLISNSALAISMPVSTHYQLSKAASTVTNSYISLESKPAINNNRDIAFKASYQVGQNVKHAIVAAIKTDGGYDAPVEVATETEGLRFDFFANGFTPTSLDERAIEASNGEITKFSVGINEPAISDRIGTDVKVVYYEGTEQGQTVNVAGLCQIPAASYSTLFTMFVRRKTVPTLGSPHSVEDLIHTGKTFCGAQEPLLKERYTVLGLQAPFSMNPQGDLVVSAFVRKEELTPSGQSARSVRVILVIDGSTGAYSIKAEGRKTKDSANDEFQSSFGSPQINEFGQIAFVGNAFHTGVSLFRKSMYYMQGAACSNGTCIPQRIFTELYVDPPPAPNVPGDTNNSPYTFIGGRPVINRCGQVATTLQYTDTLGSVPAVAVGTGSGSHPNYCGSNSNFLWRLNPQHISFTEDILLSGKAEKRDGPTEQFDSPYIQGLASGILYIAEKSLEDAPIARNSLFSSNYYSPDGGLIIRAGSVLDNVDLRSTGVVDIRFGRGGRTHDGTMAAFVRLGTGEERIYEVRPCEATGLCVDFSQATFGPDINADGISDLIKGRPVIARVKSTLPETGISFTPGVSVVADVSIDGVDPGQLLRPVTDSLGYGYYKFHHFNPSLGQIGYTANSSEGESTGQISVISPINVSLGLFALNCPPIANGACQPAVPNLANYKEALESRIVATTPTTAASVAVGVVKAEALNSSDKLGNTGVIEDMGAIWWRSVLNFKFTALGVVPNGYFKDRYGSNSEIVGVKISEWSDDFFERLRFGTEYVVLAEKDNVSIGVHELGHQIGNFDGHLGDLDIDGYNIFDSTADGQIWRFGELMAERLRIGNLPGGITYTRDWPSNASWMYFLKSFSGLNGEQNKTRRLSVKSNLILMLSRVGDVFNLVGAARTNMTAPNNEKQSNLKLKIGDVESNSREITISSEYRLEKLTQRVVPTAEIQSSELSTDGMFYVNIPYGINDFFYSIDGAGQQQAESINIARLKTLVNYIPEAAFFYNPSQSRGVLSSIVAEIQSKSDSNDYLGAAQLIKGKFSENTRQLVRAASGISKLDQSELFLEDILDEAADISTRFSVAAGKISQPGMLLRITPNKTAYSPGEKAIIKIEEIVSPKDSRSEYFLTAKFNGQPQRLDRKGLKIYEAVTPSLVAGNSTFLVEIFIQDKMKALSLRTSINSAKKQLMLTESELEKETDPEKISDLQKRVIILNKRVLDLRQRLEGLRKKLTINQTSIIKAE